MLDIFTKIMITIFKIISPLIIIISIIVINYFIYMIAYKLKGYKLKKRTIKIKRVNRPGIFKRLFILFPRQLAIDTYNKDPDAFTEYGLHLFCGEQGSGKTTALIHMLQTMENRFPKVKIRTNMGYKNEVAPINHWKDIVSNDNGIYGQIEVLDEIQTWFSSLQSKDFPPEMITEISQQRKQRKMIVGTAQVFSRIAKPIREQTTFVYLPMTLFGCLTFVRKTKTEYWDNEKQKFKRYNGMYFFVHTDKIRNAFDTYQKIQKYNEEGFKSDFERNILISNDISIIQK